MRVSHGNSLKKIEKAGGKVDSDASGSVAATPKKSGDKKRVARSGEDGEVTPAPKRGRKKKQVKGAPVDCEYHHGLHTRCVSLTCTQLLMRMHPRRMLLSSRPSSTIRSRARL